MPVIFQRLVLPPGAFRLVLAAAVVLSHLSRADIGRLAVLLFFYLSGYWTTRVWEAKFGSTGTLRFYAARYLRIAPLYLLTMVAAASLRGIAIQPENLLLIGTATSGRDPIGVSWSLDVEMQFYILIPLFAMLSARNNRWPILLLSIVGVIAGIAIESGLGVVTALKYLPVFILGLLTYTVKWRPSQRSALLSLAAFVVMTVITGFTPFLDKTNTQPFDQDIWSFFWMLPLLPYVARSLGMQSTKMDRHAGNLSYPLYLVHFPIISLMQLRFGEGYAEKLAAILISVAICVILYVLVDRPIDALRVRLTEGRIPEPTRLRPSQKTTGEG